MFSLRIMFLFLLSCRLFAFQQSMVKNPIPRVFFKKSVSTYGYNTTYSINDNNNFNMNAFLRTRKLDGCALDVNCKSGESTKILSMKFPELKMFGIDGNKYFIALAKEKYDFDFVNIEFEKYNGIREGSFRLVQVSDYLDIIISFSKAIHVLEDGGMLMHRINSKKDKQEIQDFLQKHASFINYHFYDGILFAFK